MGKKGDDNSSIYLSGLRIGIDLVRGVCCGILFSNYVVQRYDVISSPRTGTGGPRYPTILSMAPCFLF